MKELNLRCWHKFVVMRVKGERVNESRGESIIDVIKKIVAVEVLPCYSQNKTHKTPPAAARSATTESIIPINNIGNIRQFGGLEHLP